VPLASAPSIDQQVVVTVTNDDDNVEIGAPSGIDNGSKLLTTREQKEGEWKKVHRRTRSQTRAEQQSDSSRESSAYKNITRFRTDSESSGKSGASNSVKTGQGKPKKSKLFMETIANHEREQISKDPNIAEMVDVNNMSD
jgi:hypothetical protein